MEVEAVTHAVKWLPPRMMFTPNPPPTHPASPTPAPHAIILTAIDLQLKVDLRMGYPDWYTAMYGLWLQRLLNVYDFDDVGVRGNEEEYR